MWKQMCGVLLVAVSFIGALPSATSLAAPGQRVTLPLGSTVLLPGSAIRVKKMKSGWLYKVGSPRQASIVEIDEVPVEGQSCRSVLRRDIKEAQKLTKGKNPDWASIGGITRLETRRVNGKPAVYSEGHLRLPEDAKRNGPYFDIFSFRVCANHRVVRISVRPLGGGARAGRLLARSIARTLCMQASCRQGTSYVDRRVSRAEIKAGMQGVRREVQKCFDRYNRPGEYPVRVSLAAGGAVVGARVLGTHAGTPTAQCIETAVRRAEFLTPAGRPTHFRWPYVFSSRLPATPGRKRSAPRET